MGLKEKKNRLKRRCSFLKVSNLLFTSVLGVFQKSSLMISSLASNICHFQGKQLHILLVENYLIQCFLCCLFSFIFLKIYVCKGIQNTQVIHKTVEGAAATNMHNTAKSIIFIKYISKTYSCTSGSPKAFSQKHSFMSDTAQLNSEWRINCALLCCKLAMDSVQAMMQLAEGFY